MHAYYQVPLLLDFLLAHSVALPHVNFFPLKPHPSPYPIDRFDHILILDSTLAVTDGLCRFDRGGVRVLLSESETSLIVVMITSAT